MPNQNVIPLVDKYTISLYNLVNYYEVDIWENVNFNLPASANIDTLKQLFYNTYKYYEIGFETIARFLDELKDKVFDLSMKYTPLFNLYDKDFNDNDIYNNFIGENQNTQQYYATPQSQLVNTANYLTSQTNENGSENRLVGMTKAEAREIYADRIRYLYHEFVGECKNLFMGVY